MEDVQNDHDDLLVESDNENVMDFVNVVECEKLGEMVKMCLRLVCYLKMKKICMSSTPNMLML